MSNKFILSQALGYELEMAIGRAGGVATDVHWLRTANNFEKVILLARGQAKLVLNEADVQSPLIDPIVHVDRSVRPTYPYFLDSEYLKKPEFVALEKTGPSEFDASKLRKWWHPRQKKKVIVGDVIYAFLKKKKMLPSCLGYADLLGIKAKGIEFFRQNFQGQTVFGWRTIVPRRFGGLGVPCLVEDGGRVVRSWYWLGGGFAATDPALRFA